MNWDQVEGKWKQYKGAMKEKWGKLTDSDSMSSPANGISW